MKNIILITILLIFNFQIALAQEARTFNPITTPGKAPEGAQPAAQKINIHPQTVGNAMQKMFKDWNRGNFKQHLADSFYDKEELATALHTEVPLDARIRINAIKNTQTLQQFHKKLPDGKIKVYSTVSVTADTQIEFNDVEKGFRKLEGENEYILQIEGELVPVQ